LKGSKVLTGTGVSIPELGVVLHAMASSGDTNVLATPHILASDNVKAEISIGRDIPLQKNVNAFTQAAAAASQGGAVNPAMFSAGGFSTPRAKVATKITVTPHVNDSDQVRLELTEEISNEGETAGDLGVVSIDERKASTTLVVKDQQTVVIGGLVHDEVLNGETKIPVLGDIPLLGVLFRQTTKRTVKSNLLLVLTPYVIRSQDDLRAIFERKMQERQEFLDRYFVFNDQNAWSPPRDFSRTNGLVEDIRQSLREVEEKRVLERDAAPKGPHTHVPGEPVASMPAAPAPDAASRPATNAAAPSSPPATDAPATQPPPRRVAPRSQVRVE
jgi:general secretion pathway protein D